MSAEKICKSKLEATGSSLPKLKSPCSRSSASYKRRWWRGRSAMAARGYWPTSSCGPGTALNVSQIRGALQEKLPDYMIPAAFVQLARLPMTRSGKIDRRGLPEPRRSRAALDVPYAAPRNQLETVLAQLWREVLQLEELGSADDFFALGGDSLLANANCRTGEPTVCLDPAIENAICHADGGAARGMDHGARTFAQAQRRKARDSCSRSMAWRPSRFTGRWATINRMNMTRHSKPQSERRAGRCQAAFTGAAAGQKY